MTSTVQNAYRVVFNDILNSGCGLMVGEYDAKNGSSEFMYGISTVMDWIAYRVSDVDGDEFSDLFTKNMIKSEQKAKGSKCCDCAELNNCYKGQNGGKKNCKSFSPKA